MRPHVARRLLAIAMLSIGMLALTASSAAAHAFLERSDPETGAVLDAPPDAVTLRFSEPPDPELSRIEVFDSGGAPVVAGPTRPLPGEPLAMRVPLEQLPEGVYTVSWSATSTADSHTSTSSFAFGVGADPAGAATPEGIRVQEPGPSPLAVAGRWLLYAGLAVLLAATTMQFLVFRAAPPGARIALPVAWAMAASGLVAIVLAAARAADASVATFLASQAGDELVREGIAILVAGIAVVVALRRRTTTGFAIVGAAAAVGLLFHAIGGHAGAATSLRWPKILVQWVHLLAVGVWIGGLVWLLLGLREAGRERDASIRRYSRVAGFALLAAVVTGFLRSSDLLGGPGELGRLFSTAWGTALAWKLAVVVALVSLGAWNRRVNVRRLDDGHAASLRRIVGGEVALAAGVFGLTGIVAGLPPARQDDVGPPARPPEIVVSGADFATAVRARLRVTPGTPGINRFVATVEDYDTGRPVDATRVALRLRPLDRPDVDGTTIELKPGPDAVWQATDTALSLEGLWEVVVVVQTDTSSTEVPLELRTRAPPEPGQEVSVTEAAGLRIATITLPDGRSVQAYLDPAEVGPSEVHFTAFDPAGMELPLASARARASSPAGMADPVELRRLSDGHFTGEVRLARGPWRFEFDATTEEGAPLSVLFEEEVR